MTSDGGATNIVSSRRWAHNEESFQGLWRRTKNREAKDEVQQENQFSPPSSPLPLGERFTGQVMTAHNNNSHISLPQSDSGIHGQSNLPPNKVVISAARGVCLGAENRSSPRSVIVLHRVDPPNLLPTGIRDSEGCELGFYGKRIRKINIHKRGSFSHSGPHDNAWKHDQEILYALKSSPKP